MITQVIAFGARRARLGLRRSRLGRAGLAGLLLALGGVAEFVAPMSPAPLNAADFTVGATLALGGAWLLERAPATALVAIAAAVAWFLGTLAGASNGPLSATGSFFLLAYRGPVLQLLLGLPSGRLGSLRLRLVAGLAWAGSLLPVTPARTATVVAGVLVLISVGGRARLAPVPGRQALAAAAALTLGLLVVWAPAIFVAAPSTALLVADDVAVLAASGLALSTAGGLWARRAASALVIELRPGGHPGQPIAGQMARVLADPALEVRYRAPGLGWFDEEGKATDDPGEDRGVTRASAPDGGEVALVHGPGGKTDQRLAEAVAAAAALALDAARLETELRARAAQVRASRLRLLTAADAERRSLEAQLSAEVLSSLRRVERALTPRPEMTEVVAEVRAAVAEVVALAQGLYPPALAGQDLASALKDLAGRGPAVTTLELSGEVLCVPAQVREAVWFVCSEALANVARHSGASRASMRVVVDGAALRAEISDNGIGGASIGNGLRGLADRVDALGGSLLLSSPVGGPTVVRAELPLQLFPGLPR